MKFCLTIPLCLRPLFLNFIIGHSLCQHVFYFQGIKAHGSATLSSRKQLSEWLCSDITWLDVTVSCSGQPWCTVLDGKAGGLRTEAWLICKADFTLICWCFTSFISRILHAQCVVFGSTNLIQCWIISELRGGYYVSMFSQVSLKTLANIGQLGSTAGYVK